MAAVQPEPWIRALINTNNNTDNLGTRSQNFASPVLTSVQRTVEEPNCLMYLAYTAPRLFLNHFLNSSFQRTVEEPNCPYVPWDIQRSEFY
jgi:hypothetical protein